MFKKIFILLSGLIILAIACKKEEVCISYYKVDNFTLSINSENIGLFLDEGRNTDTSIHSVRNQLMFTPDKTFKFAQVKSVGFDLIPSAYANRCVDIELSETLFDPNKTVLSIDRDLDLSTYEFSGIVLEGENLLANEKLRNELLQEVVTNTYLHSGADFPITLSTGFLKPLNGQKIKFTLKLFTESGISMSDSVDVVIDVKL